MRLVNRSAMRAYRAIRPADGFKMRPAGFVIRKALEKGQQRHGPDKAWRRHKSQ
jgi:hypothetical protein